MVDSDARETDNESPPLIGPVRSATDESIAQAEADGLLGVLDRGAVSALRYLADKIDTDDALRAAYLNLAPMDSNGNVKPLQLDNVSIPTYLKYCDALGLTPAGRAVQAGKVPAKGATGGKLDQLKAARERRVARA